MQVPYQILVVILRPIKIKQTKKLWVVIVVSFTQLRALTSIMSHQCVLLQTQITNFSFQVLVRRKSLFFQFFGLHLHFFLEHEWKHVFLGAPSQDRISFFSCRLTTFLDAFLKKRMAPPTWKSQWNAICWVQICNWVVRN